MQAIELISKWNNCSILEIVLIICYLKEIAWRIFQQCFGRLFISFANIKRNPFETTWKSWHNIKKLLKRGVTGKTRDARELVKVCKKERKYERMCRLWTGARLLECILKTCNLSNVCRLYEEGRMVIKSRIIKKYQTYLEDQNYRRVRRVKKVRSYDIITDNYFCVSHKNKWKDEKHFSTAI